MTNKYLLRSDGEDIIIEGTKPVALERAQELADTVGEMVEVWPDPGNDDYNNLAAGCCLPSKEKS
jgi:hypothetical protein